MNFELTEDQEMMREMFARFLDENSSMARVRAAAPWGFDPELWRGLAEQGALSIRVPEECGGLGMGIFEAALLMDEDGRWCRGLWPKRWLRPGCSQNRVDKMICSGEPLLATLW
jgi:alkylation response protein AidB-like acyl-CoA dehydrogenase